MNTPTVDWTAAGTPGALGTPGGSGALGALGAGGLRERKKRLMRQQLSDTATRMFLERGFDAVRVTEIAEACGVSEKTVFNYFPTKESLILDRLEATMASLRTGLAEPGVAPVQAALRILDRELGAMTSWLAAQDDPVQAGHAIRRFDALIQATPSLRAYQSDMMDQFTSVAAAIVAERAGMSPDDPEPQIAATALLGLWRIQFQSLSRYLDGTRTPAQVHQAVTADVRRAAQLIETGLNSFGALARGLEHLDHLLAVGAGRAEAATATDIPRGGQTGYSVGMVVKVRPDGVVHRNVPSGSWSTFHRGSCLTRWSWRHFGSPLHRHVRPSAS